MSNSRAADRRSREIVRKELQTNLLLEAGAGSGKTQMLAERMAAGVAEGVYEIEHMAAVTFTRKAASELRDMIVTAWRESAKPVPAWHEPAPVPRSTAPHAGY